jgi:tRNA nucleotidyltransferase (CCA-adding enzyme)
VVEGDAIALARQLKERYGGRLTTHTRFGTAKWIISSICDQLAELLGQPENAGDLPEFLDLISARTEYYTHPTALPTVERGSIKLDLHRRDFTINTLALRLDGSHYGELHDYWGGLNDLRQGLVRVLHALSFVDDPTRMLRAARFERRFDFQIEKRTLELLLEARSLISQISGDRVRHELDHIMDSDRRVAILDRLAQLELLQAIHPALVWDQHSKANLAMLDHTPKKLLRGIRIDLKKGNSLRKLAYLLWFINQPMDKVQAILRKLRYPSKQVQVVLDACNLWKDLPWIANARLSMIANRLEDVPALAMYANYLAAHDDAICNNLQAYLDRLNAITPMITGNDLRERGIPPGPVYKRILGAVRDAWLDGKIQSNDQEQRYLDELISNEPSFDPSG